MPTMIRCDACGKTFQGPGGHPATCPNCGKIFRPVRLPVDASKSEPPAAPPVVFKEYKPDPPRRPIPRRRGPLVEDGITLAPDLPAQKRRLPKRPAIDTPGITLADEGITLAAVQPDSRQRSGKTLMKDLRATRALILQRLLEQSGRGQNVFWAIVGGGLIVSIAIGTIFHRSNNNSSNRQTSVQQPPRAAPAMVPLDLK